MNVLIVIPARGGSVGIPRKNVRLMNGKPLITYAICKALSLKDKYLLDVAVTSDDDEVLTIASEYPIENIRRPKYLAKADVTLDPVIYHAVLEMERMKGKKYHIVITLQPTSPTLKESTLLNAVDFFSESDFDSMISVVNHPKLSWKLVDNKFRPNYKERLNRQYLQGEFEETGAFFISKRECVTENTRLGENITVFEISENEAVDIDTELDWIVCEAILKQKKIVFRVDGEECLGMGHVYRTLTLAYKLLGHDITFVTKRSCRMGLEKLEDSKYKVYVIDSENDFYKYLEENKPDVVVNDILNTEFEYMKTIKGLASRIINFEDVGSGAKLADAVINALYENESPQPNTYNGFKYFCIRDEFIESIPKKYSSEVENILIMFGGSDPSNLTSKLYEICKKLALEYPKIKFHIITGFGYSYKDKIQTLEEANIFVHHDVKRVSQYMKIADLAITSQGRTIYELAYMGIPAIVLAQNERETEHLFAQIRNGFINLGIGFEQDEKSIIQTVRWLVETPQIRKEMRGLLLSREFRKGIERVVNLILQS